MRIEIAMRRDRSTIRRVLIRRLLAEQVISSQGELARLLDEAGYQVTQATISRDLAELGATKVDEGTDHERYVLERLPGPAGDVDRLRRALEDHLEGVVPSGNLVVLKVRQATAGAVAAAIDAAPPDGVVGTLAGDDTVLVVADESIGGQEVVQNIVRIMEA